MEEGVQLTEPTQEGDLWGQSPRGAHVAALVLRCRAGGPGQPSALSYGMGGGRQTGTAPHTLLPAFSTEPAAATLVP